MTRCRPAAAQRRGVLGEQDAVGGERQVAQRRLGGELAHQGRQIVAQQRLAAGEAHAVDAERGEAVDQLRDLLEVRGCRLRGSQT